MTLAIDIVIVSYRRRDLLLRCCATALAAADRAAVPARLIVVDNASDDGSAAAARERHPQATVIDTGANLGFARAVNQGVRCGEAPFVLLLNSDTLLEGPALGALVAALHADPGLAAVGPRLRGERGELELSANRTMAPLNDLRFKLLAALGGGGRGPLRGPLERRYARSREVASLTAACLLLRREALEQAGGFDERFFLYAEDVDLCLRLRRAGWRLRYVAEAQVRHLRGASGRDDAEATERAWRSSQLAFYRKHHPAWLPLLRAWLRCRYALAALAAAPARARARRMRAWLAQLEREREH